MSYVVITGRPYVMGYELTISSNICASVVHTMGVWNGECFEGTDIDFLDVSWNNFYPIFGVSDYIALFNGTYLFIWNEDESGWDPYEVPSVFQYSNGNLYLQNDTLFIGSQPSCCAWGIFNISSSSWTLSNLSTLAINTALGSVWGVEYTSNTPFYPTYLVKQELSSLQQISFPLPGLLSTPDVPTNEYEDTIDILFSSGQLYFVDYDLAFVVKWNGTHGWQQFIVSSEFLFAGNLTHLFVVMGNETTSWLYIYTENQYITCITLQQNIGFDYPQQWFLWEDMLIMEVYENDENLVAIIDIRSGAVDIVYPPLLQVTAIYSDGVFIYMGGSALAGYNSSICKYSIENKYQDFHLFFIFLEHLNE